MIVEIGDTGFAALMNGLRQQVILLKERCIKAETEVINLKQSSLEQQQRICELEKANEELTNKYHGLQAGTTAGASAKEIEELRNRYIAMIQEIDSCLTKLNG